jgi:hypothetical protein
MKKFKDFLCIFLTSICLFGILKVAAVAHIFFSVKFLNYFSPSAKTFLVAMSTMVCFPIAKELFRHLITNWLFGLKASWSIALKGILPGIRVKHQNAHAVLSKKDLLTIPLLGLSFNVIVILSIYSIFYSDYAYKQNSMELRPLAHFFYAFLIFAYLDLIINLSPIAKYDLYKILAIAVFKKDPRAFSYRHVKRFFNDTNRDWYDARIYLALGYLLLTFAYLCFVFVSLFSFFAHFHSLIEHTQFGWLALTPLWIALCYSFLKYFVLPCLPHGIRMRLGRRVWAGLLVKNGKKEYPYDEKDHSLNLNFPHHFYHLPMKKFVPDELFGSAVKVRKYLNTDSMQKDWRLLSETHLSEIYRTNPITYWNLDNGRLVKRLRLLLSLSAHLQKQYPFESFQYLYDVGLLAGQKYHFSRNQDLVQRTTFAPLATNLSSYFKKSYRQARFVKTILPIAIKNKITNRIDLIVVLNDVDFLIEPPSPDRATRYERTWKQLSALNGLGNRKIFSKLKGLPTEFLVYSKVIPFKRKAKLEKYFFNLPTDEISFWKKENLITEIDGQYHLNLPNRGYLIPLRFDQRMFGFKVRSIPNHLVSVGSHHPFLEFFESSKFLVEKYNDFQNDVSNFTPPSEKEFPGIHYLPGKLDPSDLYVFEGELNANAFSYMFHRSVIATGGLSFLRIHDIVVDLKESFKTRGYQRIILCFDTDKRSTYFFGRIDGLKDAHFRALQMAQKLNDAFDVCFVQENEDAERLDNDELLQRCTSDTYEAVFRRIYGNVVPFSQELDRIFKEKNDLATRYLNLNYDFSHLYHQLVVQGLSSVPNTELIGHLHAIDETLGKLKKRLFQA